MSLSSSTLLNSIKSPLLKLTSGLVLVAGFMGSPSASAKTSPESTERYARPEHSSYQPRERQSNTISAALWLYNPRSANETPQQAKQNLEAETNRFDRTIALLTATTYGKLYPTDSSYNMSNLRKLNDDQLDEKAGAVRAEVAALTPSLPQLAREYRSLDDRSRLLTLLNAQSSVNGSPAKDAYNQLTARERDDMRVWSERLAFSAERRGLPIVGALNRGTLSLSDIPAAPQYNNVVPSTGDVSSLPPSIPSIARTYSAPDISTPSDMIIERQQRLIDRMVARMPQPSQQKLKEEALAFQADYLAKHKELVDSDPKVTAKNITSAIAAEVSASDADLAAYATATAVQKPIRVIALDAAALSEGLGATQENKYPALTKFAQQMKIILKRGQSSQSGPQSPDTP